MSDFLTMGREWARLAYFEDMEDALARDELPAKVKVPDGVTADAVWLGGFRNALIESLRTEAVSLGRQAACGWLQDASAKKIRRFLRAKGFADIDEGDWSDIEDDFECPSFEHPDDPDLFNNEWRASFFSTIKGALA